MKTSEFKKLIREEIGKILREGTLSNGGNALTVGQMAGVFAKIAADLKRLPEQDAEFLMEFGEMESYGEGSMPISKVKYEVSEEENSVTFLVEYA